MMNRGRTPARSRAGNPSSATSRVNGLLRTLQHKEQNLLGQMRPERGAYPDPARASHESFAHLPGREPHQRILSDGSLVLWIVLDPCQRRGQRAFLNYLRSQVLGHVGHGGVLVVLEL